MTSLLIDPRAAAREIATPAVAWEEDVPAEGQWAGTVDRDESPQVELRRPLGYGGRVLIRQSIGSQIEREGKATVDASVMISADRAGAISFTAEEWESLKAAIDAGWDKLMAEQERVYRELGDKLRGGA